jgi:hypothetical protein
MTVRLRLTLGLLLLPAALAYAQPARAALAGLVLRDDSTEHPIAGAEVILSGTSLTARTNAAGEFQLTDIPLGMHVVMIRAMGFNPVSARLTFMRADTLQRDFLLARRPAVALDTVSVTADIRFSEFEERRRLSKGRFIGRDELEKQRSARMADVLTPLPGMRVFRAPNNEAHAMSTRGRITLMANNPRCYMHVYIDGTPAYSGGEREPLFNLNQLAPGDLQGVEFYASGAQAPAKYNRTGSACGVLLIWTRAGP